jgi:hypothetical protein
MAVIRYLALLHLLAVVVVAAGTGTLTDKRAVLVVDAMLLAAQEQAALVTLLTLLHHKAIMEEILQVGVLAVAALEQQEQMPQQPQELRAVMERSRPFLEAALLTQVVGAVMELTVQQVARAEAVRVELTILAAALLVLPERPTLAEAEVVVAD